MKILSTSDLWFPDYVGGTARVAREVAIGLVHRGHDVDMIVPETPGMPAESVVDGVVVRRMVKRSSLPRTYMDPIRFWRALARVDMDRFDVVLAQHPLNATGGSFARTRPPTAYVFHSSPSREASQRRRFGVSKFEAAKSLGVEPGLAIAERLAAARCDRILVLSRYSRCMIAADLPSAIGKVILVGGGVDAERYRPSRNRSAVRASLGVADPVIQLVTVRRLVARTGVDALIAACGRLRATLPELRLTIIGDGEERGRLVRIVTEAGLSDVISFSGRLPDDEIIRWYQASDLFVLPTLAYEGFGMATAEALACGTPVVGTPVGATPELLSPIDRRLLAADATPKGIADAVARTTGILGDALRARCRRYVTSELDWSRVLDRWEVALSGIAEHRRPARQRR